VTVRQVIEVEGLGHGTMPIPLAVRIGGLVVTGALSGRDPATGQLPESLADETAQLFRNIRAVLKTGGTGTEAVAKMTFFVRERNARDAINAEWVAMFPEPSDRPVRHTLVQELPAVLRVQADVLAVIEEGSA
jgi:2-iminobutanoate/2-iminopropanoate deaminase